MSLAFFIGLLRDYNHKPSDYPLTTAFITPTPSFLSQGLFNADN